MYHGTAHVILGSGLTIAGATSCLHFCRLPYFQTLGIPLAIGMLAAGGHRRCALARSHPRGVPGARSRRAARPAGLSAQLQRPQFSAAWRPGERGVRGRGPAFPVGADESRNAANRNRSRCPQLRGQACHRPDRQGRLPHPGHDFFRPLRNYLYWEPHCFDIPVCWSMRSIFDLLDGIDTLSDDIATLLPDLDQIDALMPQMVEMMTPILAIMKSMRTQMLTMHSTFGGLQDQMQAMQKNSRAMGTAFDDAKNDDSFYLPPEVFDNADFKRGLKMFVSPDGKAVRFIISTRVIQKPRKASRTSTPSRTRRSR